LISEVLQNLAVLALPVLIAITLHEAAHGFVAWRCGDNTAYNQGRISLNPLRHIDPFGTVVLPLLIFFSSGGRFFFGYAKPVPVNPRQLRHPRRDMVLVAAAGPAANFLIAVAAALLLHPAAMLQGGPRDFVMQNLLFCIAFNVMLGIFNLLPIPPLDGGRVAVGLLPRPLAKALAKLEGRGMLILILLILVLPWVGQSIGIDLNILGWILGPASDYVTKFILMLTGW
jgi:Zn-dependent protease